MVMVLDKSKHYTYDSRNVKMGDSFICLPKGEGYIEDALNRGAVDVIHMSREQFANNAHEYFDDPTKKVCLIGITGTNGKTSVSYFTAQLLEAMGHNVLVIGTINSTLTTPESWDILEKIKDHIDQGGTHVILEVSSHGIDQQRVLGFDFNIKCITNITHDHLDYHKTFENYKQTKMHFMLDYPGVSIYSDDYPQISSQDIPLCVGSFHRKNVASAVEIVKATGVNESDIKPHLTQLVPPKGRFQAIQMGQPFTVIVDFAHTPDALDMVLNDALLLVNGKKDRLKVVFGCGGDRDKTKRSKMAQVAEMYSDCLFLTADNSRSESTLDIISDIQSGISNDRSIALIAPDRQEAIASAIQSAQDGDVVIIAGKGHEVQQIGKNFSYYFSDIEVAEYELTRQRKYQTNHRWVLNQPDADADVLFISKKLMPLLKITYSQFRRSLPTPSTAKVRDYVSKLKGEKIIVLESSERFSAFGFLAHYCGHCDSVTTFEFDHQKTQEHNLVGLTLIDQTDSPIIIKIDPNKMTNLNRIIDIISPQHLIIGDIYHQRRYIEPLTQKVILNLLEEKRPKFSLWCSQKMSDLSEPLAEMDYSQIHLLGASSWMGYCLDVAHELAIKLEIYHDDPNHFFQQYLISNRWLYKLTFSSMRANVYVLKWQLDPLDLKQKVAYFRQNIEPIIHHVLPSTNQQGISNELLSLVGNVDGHTMHDYSQIDMGDFLSRVESNQHAIHLVWVDGPNPLQILEEQL